MIYFKHYANASDSKSLNKIFDKYSHAGIAFWWMLLELCSEHWDGHSEPNFEFHQRTVATKLKSSPRRVETWLELCSDSGMCAFAKNGTQFSISVPKLLEVKTSRRVVNSNKKELVVYIEENKNKNKSKSNNPKKTGKSDFKNIEVNKKCVEILEYFNLVTKKNIMTKLETHHKLIRARLSEGFTVDDFKKVIDIKYKGWINNPKMCAYIKPSTLFSGKFDNYLNEIDAKDSGDEYDEMMLNIFNKVLPQETESQNDI